MNKLLSKIILISLLTFSFNNVFSQTETDSIKQEQIVIIKMKNGDEYKGTISKRDSETIVLKTVNGEISLIASNVSAIENYDYTGKFEFANPHDTRYFFGPSGIPIKKGKGYYQNILVTTNFFNYGITNNISIGGGFEFISTVSGSPIWFLTPKVGFDISENIHVGAGFIMAGFAAEGTATLGYGVFTLGQSETNLSIGAGYGLLDGELSDYPAIMISGTHRISKSIALLSENYVIPTSFYFGIHGIRILSKKNSFDIGAIVIPDIADFIPALPYVGYVRIF
jgi:small nuclear ribonucleoprotein (snRNP)-like protein